MIFISVGSQKFQFNRLLAEIDRLIENNTITDEVFAQIGNSDYKPRNYKYVDFMTQDDFNKLIEKSDIIITHGGTGVIINSIKKGKKVIAIPRLSKYKEHVDDHQIQLINEFKELNLIEAIHEVDELEKAIKKIKEKRYNKYISNTSKIVESIEKFLGSD